MKNKQLKRAFVLLGSVLLVIFVINSLLVIKKQIDDKKNRSHRIEAWLSELVRFECAGCKDGFRKVDPDGQYAYSCLQFHETTFKEQSRIFKLDGDINSCADQKRVARAMFEANPRKAAQHWKTSIFTRGLGLPPEI